MSVRLQQQSRHRRRERQRYRQRDRCRGGDGDRELLEEGTLQSGDESGRQEDADEHERNREQGAADFVHRLVRGFLGRHALFDVALDVLDDDDGVVDHDADGENQAKQRQRVERDPHQAHDEECADERDGNGEDRDDRCAPRLQEQNHDEDHEHERFSQRVDHGVNRELNKLRRIVDDGVADARREVLFQVLHLSLDGRRRRERIRAGLLKDDEGRRGLVVQIRVDGVVLGAKLDTRDVTDADDGAIRFGVDHDVFELIRGGQASERFDVDRECTVGRCRRLVDRSGRDLQVGGLQSRYDFTCGQAARGDLVGV